MNGRFATSAFAIAGVMFGNVASSFSATVFTSTTPSDLPTCARISTEIAAITIAANTTFTLFISVLLENPSTRRERRMPIGICKTNESELRHHSWCQRRRCFCPQDLP